MSRTNSTQVGYGDPNSCLCSILVGPSRKDHRNLLYNTLDTRGGIPENTLVAIRQSEQKGAVAVEVDLAFTKDRHPVLLHDTTVDRTSNGSGTITSLTLTEVRELDFGVHAG